MSQFLRDEQFENLTIDAEALRKTNEDIVEVREKYTSPLRTQLPERKDFLFKALFCTYVIRFDGKVFQFYNDFAQVMKCFTDAKEVERIVFTVEILENRNKPFPVGKKIDLRVDGSNKGNCYLVVQDDDK